MAPSTMFAYNESFDSGRFDLFGEPNGTTYGCVQGPANFNTLQELPFGFSDNLDFVDSMNHLKKSREQSPVISTSNDTREVIGVGTSDSYRLSRGEGMQTTYPPLNSSGVRRQKTPYPLPSNSTGLGPASTSSSTGCVRTRVVRRTHCSAPSRNPIATAEEANEIMLLLNREDLGDEPDDLVCPVRRCTHAQLNGRIQDFHRHLATHLEKKGEIRCRGVPWEQFLRDRHLFPKISMEEQPYAVSEGGGLWIGGCLKTFSRSDALKRHLRKTCCATS